MATKKIITIIDLGLLKKRDLLDNSLNCHDQRALEYVYFDQSTSNMDLRRTNKLLAAKMRFLKGD